jgi:hypothetical protein
VLEGAGAGDQFGTAVACGGDVNGDGFSDVLVGAPIAAPGGLAGGGVASLYLGSSAGLVVTPAYVWSGVASSDLLGFSLSGAGDVNGDGFSDVMISAYAADPGGRANAGTVFLHHGSRAGISATPARVLGGALTGDFFGRSVASADDVNGDGFSDVIIGAFGADPGGRSAAGAAMVYHGGVSGVSPTPARVLEGTNSIANFGGWVAARRAPSGPMCLARRALHAASGRPTMHSRAISRTR